MENARQCPCGGFGHLEAYASATALVQRAVEALGRDETTVLRRRLAEDNLTARAIHEAAEAGDALARRLMRETARYLAVGAVSLMHTIDPDLVLFGGGMIAAGPKFLADIRADIRSMALPVPAAQHPRRVRRAGRRRRLHRRRRLRPPATQEAREAE